MVENKETRLRVSKKRCLLLPGLLLLTLCLLGTGSKLYRKKQEILKKSNENLAVLGFDEKVQSGLIELEGKTYRRNTAVRAILCIGVDSAGEMELHQASGEAGQADGLFLAAQDMSRDTVKILMIPRDTMTEITLFDLMGNELGKDVQHLTLAYAYGDGREESCELMAEAVSDLMYGLRIDGYLAMNTSTISLLNDEAGGVTVLIEEEGLEQRDSSMVRGKKIHLMGKQAEIFVRYRDTSKPQTALSRMERQQQYISAYLATVKKNAAKDNTQITRLVNLMEEYMITNMSKDQYMDMGLAVLNSSQSLGDRDFLTVPGEARETELYDEYHPDKEALKRLVVELFYKEV